MALLEIRLFGDPVLRQTAREVTDFDQRLARLAGDMLETMRAAPGVGLAAPQVGVLKRLFTWEIVEEEADPDDADDPAGRTAAGDGDGAEPGVRGGAVVNPTLVEASQEPQVGEEGCLSFPGLFYPVERPLRATVRWQDLDGDEHTTEVEGFDARVWLHEMDHLDGILFLDHLARHDRREAMRRMREYRIERGLDEPPDRGGGNLLLGRRS